MPNAMRDLGIDRWTGRERLDLIQEICESLPIDEVPAWQLELIDERLAEADTSTEPGRPWQDVLAKYDHKS